MAAGLVSGASTAAQTTARKDGGASFAPPALAGAGIESESGQARRIITAPVIPNQEGVGLAGGFIAGVIQFREGFPEGPVIATGFSEIIDLSTPMTDGNDPSYGPALTRGFPEKPELEWKPQGIRPTPRRQHAVESARHRPSRWMPGAWRLGTLRVQPGRARLLASLPERRWSSQELLILMRSYVFSERVSGDRECCFGGTALTACDHSSGPGPGRWRESGGLGGNGPGRRRRPMRSDDASAGAGLGGHAERWCNEEIWDPITRPESANETAVGRGFHAFLWSAS
jgi:hypothetical protein